MDKDKALFLIILIGVFLLGMLVTVLIIPDSEPVVYNTGYVPIHFEDKKECKYMGYRDTYYSSRVNELVYDLDDAEDDLDDAEDRLDYAYMVGDANMIARAKHDVNEAEDDLDDLEDDLDRAKRDYNHRMNEMMLREC